MVQWEFINKIHVNAQIGVRGRWGHGRKRSGADTLQCWLLVVQRVLQRTRSRSGCDGFADNDILRAWGGVDQTRNCRRQGH